MFKIVQLKFQNVQLSFQNFTTPNAKFSTQIAKFSTQIAKFTTECSKFYLGGGGGAAPPTPHTPPVEPPLSRVVIERSFALLLGRFRRLRHLDMNRIDLIPAVILAACTLHNICLKFPEENRQ